MALVHDIPVLPVADALQTLFDPDPAWPTCFAPGLGQADFTEFETRAVRAVSNKRADALVIDRIPVLRAGVRETQELIVNSLSQKRNTVIIPADSMIIDRKYQDIIKNIDNIPSENVKFLKFVLRNRETFSNIFFEAPARRESWRCVLVSNSSVENQRLCSRIMNLLDAHFEDVDPCRRAVFMTQLEGIIRQVPLESAARRIIDPGSGLEFYPVARDRIKWADFAAGLPRPSKTYSRNPAGFLLDQYGHYIDAGLLYSGHLQQSDQQLYSSIRMHCVGSPEFSNADEFYAHHGILTAADLSNPSADNIARVNTIIDINVALAGRKAILGQIATHGKRTGSRALRRPGTTPIMTLQP